MFTFVGAFWPDPVLVLGRSTVVGDSGDVFTGVVAVNKIKYINNEKRHKQNHNQNWKTMSKKLTAVGRVATIAHNNEWCAGRAY